MFSLKNYFFSNVNNTENLLIVKKKYRDELLINCFHRAVHFTRQAVHFRKLY